ncbi:MAG TPA: hypothetical protein VL281_09500, partial [Mycobacteriales bacterium]|nr:hypothetical protein [Mycobacteriales bacterium]
PSRAAGSSSTSRTLQTRSDVVMPAAFPLRHPPTLGLPGTNHDKPGEIVLVDVEGEAPDQKFTFRGEPKPATVPDAPLTELAGSAETEA